MLRLVNQITDSEVFVGEYMLGFRILAIDYVERRVLLRGWNNQDGMSEDVLRVIAYVFVIR